MDPVIVFEWTTETGQNIGRQQFTARQWQQFYDLVGQFTVEASRELARYTVERTAAGIVLRAGNTIVTCSTISQANDYLHRSYIQRFLQNVS